MKTAQSDNTETNKGTKKRFASMRKSFVPYVKTFLTVVLITLLGEILTPYFDLINIAILYLLPVLISAVRWGRGPSFFAAGLGVLVFDFFFVPPVLSLTVHDVRHVFIFGMFLLVAIVTGTMATKLRNELDKTKEREQRTLALYALSQKIAAESDLKRVLKTFVERVAGTIRGDVIMLVHNPDAEALLEVAACPSHNTLSDDKERAVAHWVLEHGQRAGRGTETLSAAQSRFFSGK
jgi:two-component system sensor histidine kinase KdpD